MPFEKFFKKFGLKKISYGYESFSAGNYRQLISLDDKNFNFIPLICYEIIYSGKVNLKSDKTNFIIGLNFPEARLLREHLSHLLCNHFKANAAAFTPPSKPEEKPEPASDLTEEDDDLDVW